MKWFKPRFKRMKEAECYYIDDLRLEMGECHMLATYQRLYPLYDKFLPYLVKYIPDSNIIDIGANVGDTMAMLVKHTNGKIYCVEADTYYFSLLEKNLNEFPTMLKDKVELIPAFISDKEETTYTTMRQDGTAKKIEAEPDSNRIPTYRIDSLVAKQKLSNIGLIKIDTDGYDAECILSCGHVLNELQPYLYWEGEIENNEQMEKYIESINYMWQNGYQNHFVFDNFGSFIFETDKTGLIEILQYLKRGNDSKTAKTMYYVDVLSCNEKQAEDARNAICDFLSYTCDERNIGK